MAADFVKVYSQFWFSSISQEELATRICFLALLSLADENGIVRTTPEALARYANVTPKQADKALTVLQEPDPQSTSPDDEGRRVTPWGEGSNQWLIVNYRAYYEKSREEERATYKREWDRQFRPSGHTRKTGVSDDEREMSQNVTGDVSQAERDRARDGARDRKRRQRERDRELGSNPKQSDTVRHSPSKPDQSDHESESESDSETDTESDNENEIKGRGFLSAVSTAKRAEVRGKSPPVPTVEPEGFAEFWVAFPKRAGSNPRAPAVSAFKARLAEGVSAPALTEAARRYGAYVVAAGLEGTQYVKQAQFWLSPTFRGWEQDWRPPADKPKKTRDMTLKEIYTALKGGESDRGNSASTHRNGDPSVRAEDVPGTHPRLGTGPPKTAGTA